MVAKIDDIMLCIAKMTYLDLSSHPKYMDHYTGALFLPHTDLSKFPSVVEELEQIERHRNSAKEGER